MVEVEREAFEALVGDALDSIPEELARLIDNVVVEVVDEPRQRGLLGLYVGVPLTRRDSSYSGMVMPDRIEIYRGPICRRARSEEQVREQVRITVVHEVAHHFGIGDDRLRELGWG